MGEMAQAQAQAANSRAAREQARVALAANFPEIPLPIEPPETSVAMVPAQRLAAMRDLVIERSHEIRAAEREAQRLAVRSEEHTPELQSLMRISYAVFCLKKKKQKKEHTLLTSTIQKRQR